MKQISLGLCHLSGPCLSTWRMLGSLDTHKTHRKDWSDWANAQADPRSESSLGTQVILLVFSCSGTFVYSYLKPAYPCILYSVYKQWKFVSTHSCIVLSFTLKLSTLYFTYLELSPYFVVPSLFFNVFKFTWSVVFVLGLLVQKGASEGSWWHV